MEEAQENLAAAASYEAAAQEMSPTLLAELVADRGYRSGAVLVAQQDRGLRTYIAEPKRGRRRWRDRPGEQAATYANRRRLKSNRGAVLMKRRGERIERSFAHVYDTGGLRRVHLRGHANILKRARVHIGDFNRGLVLRKKLGAGTPRGLRARLLALFRALTVAGTPPRNLSHRPDGRSHLAESCPCIPTLPATFCALVAPEMVFAIDCYVTSSRWRRDTELVPQVVRRSPDQLSAGQVRMQLALRR